MDALEKAGKKSPKVVMINGAPTDSNSKPYKDGATQVLKKRGAQIVKSYDTPDWSPDKAQSEMEASVTSLGKDGFDAVYSANDGMAGGAIAALKGAGVDPSSNRYVTGQDAELAGIQRILAGEQLMTVYQPIIDIAETSAEIAVPLAQGKQPPADLTKDKVDNGQKQVPSSPPGHVRGAAGQHPEHRRQGGLPEDGRHLHGQVQGGLPEGRSRVTKAALAVDAGQTTIRAALSDDGRGPRSAVAPGVIRVGMGGGREAVSERLLAAVAELGPLPRSRRRGRRSGSRASRRWATRTSAGSPTRSGRAWGWSRSRSPPTGSRRCSARSGAATASWWPRAPAPRAWRGAASASRRWTAGDRS